MRIVLLLLIAPFMLMSGDRVSTPRLKGSPDKDIERAFPIATPHMDSEHHRHRQSRLKIKLAAATAVITTIVSAGVTFGIYFGQCHKEQS